MSTKKRKQSGCRRPDGNCPKPKFCGDGGHCFNIVSALQMDPDDSYKEFMGDYGDSPVLSKAVETVDGRDKQEHYGPPEESMRRIGLIWSGILGVEISPEKVALMMLGLKAARLSIDPRHVDSLVDAGGYVRILERLAK